MTQLITIVLIIVLAADALLERAKNVDKEEEIIKRLARLESKERVEYARLRQINSSLERIKEGLLIQETGEIDMAAITDTNVVFRCNKQFKASIEEWAKEHDLNLSEACRNLINLELSKKQTLVDSLTYSLNYVNYLKSQGLVAEDATEERLSQAAADYAAYMGKLDKQ